MQLIETQRPSTLTIELNFYRSITSTFSIITGVCQDHQNCDLLVGERALDRSWVMHKLQDSCKRRPCTKHRSGLLRLDGGPSGCPNSKRFSSMRFLYGPIPTTMVRCDVSRGPAPPGR